jgi:DNA-binding NarL/FixJ family response regulator
MSEKTDYRIVVVDDHPIVRDGIIRLIETSGCMHVVGEAGDGDEVMGLVAGLLPDAVVLDLTLESSDGLSLIGQIITRYPTTAILILSMHDESTHALRCIKAGARGYLMKKSASREIVTALQEILKGKIHVSPAVKEQMLNVFTSNKNSANSVETLSPREFQVFRLYGQGLRTAHIASKLQCSPKTVETHCLRIRRKMNFHCMNELVASAGLHVGMAS